MQPITLWSIPTGPNPWKVAVILKELDIPYTTKMISMAELKQEPFLSINPNGRAPAIEDPNTGITLWETGAIIPYLIETYDKAEKLTYTSSPAKFQLQQWLSFQISGQGPYFGQAGWFLMFHPDKLPSAITRYLNEMIRVVGVLEAHLASHAANPTPTNGFTPPEHPVLVGDKVTYADLSFVVWNTHIAMLMSQGGMAWDDSQYPHFKKWHGGMLARPAVAEVMAEMQKEMQKAYGA